MVSKHIHLRSIGLSVAFFLFSSACTCFGESYPDVKELVEGYNKACHWNQKISMRISSEISSTRSDLPDPFQLIKIECIYRRNGNQAEWLGTNQIFKDSKAKLLKNEDEFMFVFNGKEFLFLTKDIGYGENFHGYIHRKNYDQALSETLGDYYYGGFLQSYIGVLGSLAEMLSRSSSVRITGKDQINGTLCYVLEDKTELSLIRLWIAPDKGYNALKITETGLSKTWWVTIDSIDLKKIDDNLIPVSGCFKKTNKMDDGTERNICVEVEFNDIDLKPDFKALGAFGLALPEGSQIIDFENQELKYHVSGGKLIPDFIEPQSLVDKHLPDMNEFIKTDSTEDNTPQNDETKIQTAFKPDETVPPESFLDADALLAGWESTYGSIKTMSVSYYYRLVDYKPPKNNPNEPSPIAYEYLERVEDGNRYHVRCSTAKDGFDRPENITEHAFDGKIAQEYWGVTKHGTIQTGLTGRGVESLNYLKNFMLLEPMMVQGSLAEEYPNGVPRFILRFRTLKSTAVIRPRLESVAGQWCHVVELSNIKGPPGETKHIFWMAHDKGMCLMKYQRYTYKKMDKEIEVEQISSADMDGTTVWYPVKARRTYDDAWGMIKDELTVENFIPNIKVDADTFRFDFPPGTEVFDKIRDFTYKVTTEQPKSLLEKTPPALSDFGTEFAQANFNGKSILVCFFDMQQRPSRNCLKELSKKVDELKDKDIVVVAVQATKLDEKVLDEWLKENDIPFPAGMIRANEEKSRIVWGVRSLPWLILTDKQHVVRAEGFALEELDEKIRENK